MKRTVLLKIIYESDDLGTNDFHYGLTKKIDGLKGIDDVFIIEKFEEIKKCAELFQSSLIEFNNLVEKMGENIGEEKQKGPLCAPSSSI